MQHKTLSLSKCEIKLSQESGIFSGYASVFDGVDSYGDTILPGAYKQTLKDNGLPKMFLQHDTHYLPVGKYRNVDEDSKGLWVEGELTPNLSTANDAKAALAHETLDGLSIGYALRKSDYTPSDTHEGGRIIKNVSLLSEISLVTFPADTNARIAEFKSQLDALETITEFERYLREVGNFSKEHAKMLVHQAKTLFGQREAGENEAFAKQVQALSERLGKFKLPN
jgi:HK97 family phage prohead protease